MTGHVWLLECSHYACDTDKSGEEYVCRTCYHQNGSAARALRRAVKKVTS